MSETTPQDTTNAPETAEAPAPAPEGTPDAPDVDAEHEDKPGKEAARYRRQLRDTETERDALAARVETMQRAEAERLAGDTLSKPAALWATGTTLADLLDAGGNLDPAKVADAAATAADALGAARPSRPPRPDHSQGATGYVGTADPWVDAMRVG